MPPFCASTTSSTRCRTCRAKTETFRRLDIAINIAHDEPERMVLALRNAHHPWIRRGTEQYANGNIRFPGTEAVFQAYWKLPPARTGAKRKAWKTPHVLRLELQLKTADKIAQFLDLEEPPVRELPPMADDLREVPGVHARLPALRATGGQVLDGGPARPLRVPRPAPTRWGNRDGLAPTVAWVTPATPRCGARWPPSPPSSSTSTGPTCCPPTLIPATVDVHLDGTTTPVPPMPIIRPVPAIVHAPVIRRGWPGYEPAATARP